MRSISVITFSLLIAVSYGFYQLQFQVEQRQDRATALEQQIKSDKENIKILQAEWALLASPKRLQQLSNRFLELAPIDPAQIRTIDELTQRADGVEGAAFIDIPEAMPGEAASPVDVADLPQQGPAPLPMVPVANRGGEQ
jgi:hypothetical protein